MSISSLFFKGAVLWFVAGTSVGMQMGLSGNHNFIDAHAHLNLLGWVSSALFGCFYALHPAVAAKRYLRNMRLAVSEIERRWLAGQDQRSNRSRPFLPKPSRPG